MACSGDSSTRRSRSVTRRSSKPALSHFVIVVLAVVSTLFGLQRALGQVFYGSLVGTVTDSSGAVVPGATVTITRVETNESRTETTNGSGDYVFSTVAAGTYKVAVSKTGFANFQQAGVTIALNTAVRVNAVLGLGSQSQSVEVSADAPLLQTDSADVHGEITSKEYSDLPQPTRTYEGILSLIPGISPPKVQNDPVNNPMRSMWVYANGTSASGTAVRIDGATATNPWQQFISTAVPSVDAIQSVNVVTASSGADEGLMNGAAINVQMKSGTNSLHGSAYEYHYDNLFKAKPWALPVGQRMPKLLDNNAGGTLGGPILKNCLFFFGSYEGDFLHTGGGVSIGSIPSATARRGMFPVADSAPIYDPATGNLDGTGRTPFGTDPTGTYYVIPQNRIDPIAAKVMALLPQPNYGGASAETSNWLYLSPEYYKLQKIDSKFDYTATDKLRFFTRYSYYLYNVPTTPEFGSSPLSGHNTDANSQGNFYALSASGIYVPKPNLVIQLLFGVNHSVENLFAPYTNQKYGQDVLGIPGSNVGNLPQAGGFPDIYFDNWDGYGYSYPSLVYNDPLFQYGANVNWTKGKHTIRFGADVSQQHMNHQEVQNSYLYSGSGLTGLNGGPATGQYNDLAGFLLGLDSQVSNSVMTESKLTLRTWQFSPYVGDQWQVNRRLTVAFGTRWDYYPVPTRADRGIEFFNFNTLQYEICGKGPNPKNCGIHVSKAQFSPRLGFAYRPTDRVVLRAGYTVNYEQINMYRDGLYSYPEEITTYFSPTNPNATGFTPYGSLEQGIPVLPNPDLSSGFLTLPAGVTFVTDPKNFVRGYTQSYNAALEQDFGHGWIGQIGYVGTHTVHQHTRMNINYGQVGGGPGSQPFNNGTYGTGITGNEVEILPLESMVYNSLQATMKHRFTQGFEVGAGYTWSKWMGTCCDDHGDSYPEIPIPQYFSLNKAVMPGDRTHNVQISWLWDPPFGENKALLNHGVGAVIFGGWQLNAITSFESGTPFSVTSSSASLNAPGVKDQRADQIKSRVTILHGKGSGHPWFDTSAFAPVSAVRFGTASYDSVRGPGYANGDMNLFRTFKIRENLAAKFSVDVYNVTNHPHFYAPNANVNSSSFGIISSAGNAQSRTIDERNVKLGAKFTF